METCSLNTGRSALDVGIRILKNDIDLINNYSDVLYVEIYMSKLTKIVISIENGLIYPVVKVCDHDTVEVIVVDTDRSSIWKPEIKYNCDKEVEEISHLANDLRDIVFEASERNKE